MDRVQVWKVRGDLARFPSTFESVVAAIPKVRQTSWDSTETSFSAKMRLGVVVLSQKITARIADRDRESLTVNVCVESLQLLDYGRNRRVLEELRQRTRSAG